MSWGKAVQQKQSLDDIKAQRVKKRLHKAFALAEEIGLTNDDDRHDLAKLLPKCENGKWTKLDEYQLDRLLWMLEGYLHISHALYVRSQVDGQ